MENFLHSFFLMFFFSLLKIKYLIHFVFHLVDRLCATSHFDDQCADLQRGNSEVNCQRVQDSIECAQRLQNGTAEFGIFSAESAKLLAHLNWEGLTVVRELRHRERIQSESFNKEKARFS